MFIYYYATPCISERNLSEVPELTQAATPLFQLKPPYNIAPFFDRICPFKSPITLDVSRFAFPMLTWHNTFGFQQSRYTVLHTHCFFSAVGVARCGLEGLVFETRLARNLPHPSRPAPRPSLPPVQWVKWVCFLRVKQPERGLDLPPPSSAVVTEHVEVYSTFFPTPACLHCFLYSELYFYLLFLFRRKVRCILNVVLLLRK
jgi:hypothetical protein